VHDIHSPCRTSLSKIIMSTYMAGSGSQESGDTAPLLLPVSPSYASVEQDDPRRAPMARAASVPPAASMESPSDSRENATASSVAVAMETVPVVDQEGSDLPLALQDGVLHTLLTTFILAMTLAVTLTVTSLDRILGVVGATGSTTICFILPAVFYTQLHANQPRTRTRIAAYCLGFAGVCIMVCCLIMQATH
jgi:hypothetical protein